MTAITYGILPIGSTKSIDLLDKFTHTQIDFYNNYCKPFAWSISDPTGAVSLSADTLTVTPDASTPLGLNSFDLIVSLQDFAVSETCAI